MTTTRNNIMFDPTHEGPLTTVANELHGKKYRARGEDFRGYANRVAFGLADNGDHYHALRPILMQQRFLPAGRVQGSVGMLRKVTSYNCFVSGDVLDTYVGEWRDGPEKGSIMWTASAAAATMRMGGGIGYNFSNLRPRGFRIMKLDSNATGPVSFMHIYDAVCRATSSTDDRRGAQMAVLDVEHPDILEFVQAKQEPGVLTGFNLSVGVSDAFMEAALAGNPFKLRWSDGATSTEKEIDAAELWETIMRSTWDHAEPGVIFLDAVNRMNNLYYCERIRATNPCGEQPLPPNGACLLGSFNAARYLRQSVEPGRWHFDFDQLADDIPHVVRAMDNVVDRSIYPLPDQEVEAKRKRRMGLGVTGMANAAEACAGPYGGAAYLEFQARVLAAIRDGAYRASALLAKEKGSFPLYDADKYLAGKFVATLPDDVLALIKAHGIRNSHLTSIAPTGTISMAADNVSSGIEPTFARSVKRPVHTSAGLAIQELEDFGHAFLGIAPTEAAAVTAAQHVDVLVGAQRHVDSAVSKTCNVDGRMPWADFKDIYKRAWEGGAKGCTTFNKDGKRQGLIVDGGSCEIGPDGRRDCQ